MDHITCTETEFWHHVKVPFLCRKEYDGLAFAQYPARQGWHTGDGKKIDFSRSSRDDQAVFLQTWLYFGMLTEVLGEAIKIQDFVEGDYVTTKRLPQYTHKWHQSVLQMSATDRHECHLRIQRCLEKVRDCCQTLLKESNPDCPLPPEICLSIRIMGETLSQTKDNIWASISPQRPSGYIELRGKWGSSTVLENLLLDKAWCPNHIAFLENYPPASTNSAMYFASSLHRPNMGSHGACSVAACISRKQSLTTYPVHHSSPFHNCTGDCPKIEPNQELIRDIIGRNGIPVLQASIFGTDIEVDVIEYHTGMEYVAISHVWSDGLGNENSNWLPHCQLVHLTNAVKTTQGKNSGDQDKTVKSQSITTTTTVLFWIDSICVPRGCSTMIQNMALNRMVDIYENAFKVLVLDSELYRIDPSTNFEALVRLTCSNWMRRLWTLQEGILAADRLHVLFKGGTLDVWSELKNLELELKSNPSACNPITEFAIRTGIQNSAKSHGAKRMSWLFADMNWRSTSQITDEALIVANMLGFAPSSIMQSPPEERMKEVICMMKEFPQRIIFAPGLRFEEEGYRWMLRSFMDSSRFSLSWNMGTVQKVHLPLLSSSVPSISVSYPGYLLEGPFEYSRPWDFTLKDVERQKLLRVKERYSSPDEVLSQGIGMFQGSKAKPRQIGLILHNLSPNRSHGYGAIVSLDDMDSANLDKVILSGIHYGPVNITTSNMGSQQREETKPASLPSIQCLLETRTWILR